jgi:hypothetical protein
MKHLSEGGGRSISSMPQTTKSNKSDNPALLHSDHLYVLMLIERFVVAIGSIPIASASDK